MSSKRFEVERTYRAAAASDLKAVRIVVGESDLWVLAALDLTAAITPLLKALRRQLKEYLYQNPIFGTTLSTYPRDENAPPLVKSMIEASNETGVGPMAAVAGAIAGIIGQTIGAEVKELIIENGGDIYLRSQKIRTVAVYAGQSPFSGRLGLQLPPQPDGLGICTSAGTVGPSLSLGQADAVVILASDVALADAAATAVANQIQDARTLPQALKYVQTIPGLSGCLLIKDQKMAAWGKITLVALENKDLVLPEVTKNN